MNHSTKTLLAFCASMALAGASPTWAETPVGPGYGPMMGWGGQAPMMRGYGPGSAAGIELNDEQRGKMRDIQREQFQKNMGLRDKMMAEYSQLESLYDADKPDAKAVQESYDRLHALRKQMIESHLQARHRMHDLMTDDQRKAWRSQRRAWGPMGMLGQGGYGPGYGHGPGMMGPGYGYGQMGPSMMGPGYGYGPMGPGMMGPGYGYGPMGPGMMHPGYGPWWMDD